MEKIFELAITDMLNNGYAIVEDFITPHKMLQLNLELENRKVKGMTAAGTGNQIKPKYEGQRGDFISWIEEGTLGVEQDYVKLLEQFMTYLNQTCYLGLIKSEIHFASYPSGSSYKKHLDAFQIDNKRKISIITYLNNNWSVQNGGELVIYHEDKIIKILPIGGRMVCFESSKVFHEVFTSTIERNSLAGWILTL